MASVTFTVEEAGQILADHVARKMGWPDGSATHTRWEITSRDRGAQITSITVGLGHVTPPPIHNGYDGEDVDPGKPWTGEEG